MEDLIFELEAENYSHAYDKVLSKLEKEGEEESLWIYRSICSIGLTEPENDKSKEALKSIEKVDGDSITDKQVELFSNAAQTAAKKFRQRFEEEHQKVMQEDKPDSVTVGTRALSADFERNVYIRSKEDILENISLTFDRIGEAAKENEKSLKMLIDSFKELLSIGFSKVINDADATWRTTLRTLEKNYKEYNPDYVMGKDTGEGNCFIATAVYGSYEAQEVKVLRSFRDMYLKTNFMGRRLVQYYYQYGEIIAKIINGKTTTKKVLAIFILDPLVVLLQKALHIEDI